MRSQAQSGHHGRRCHWPSLLSLRRLKSHAIRVMSKGQPEDLRVAALRARMQREHNEECPQFRLRYCLRDRLQRSAVASDQIEYRKSVVVADDGFGVDHTRANRHRCNGFGGEREAFGEIVAVSGAQTDGAALPMGEDAEAIVLDLV